MTVKMFKVIIKQILNLAKIDIDKLNHGGKPLILFPQNPCVSSEM